MYAVSAYGGKESAGSRGRPHHDAVLRHRPGRGGQHQIATSGPRTRSAAQGQRGMARLLEDRDEKKLVDLEIFPESAATSKTPKKRWAAPARAADQDQ